MQKMMTSHSRARKEISGDAWKGAPSLSVRSLDQEIFCHKTSKPAQPVLSTNKSATGSCAEQCTFGYLTLEGGIHVEGFTPKQETHIMIFQFVWMTTWM